MWRSRSVIKWNSGRFGGINVESFNEYPTRNVEETIQETQATNSVPRKVERLFGLDGVKVRTASALLLFVDPEVCTVLDINAGRSSKSLTISMRTSNVPDTDEYQRYLGVCHTLANEVDVSLRALDRALWVLRGESSCHGLNWRLQASMPSFSWLRFSSLALQPEAEDGRLNWKSQLIYAGILVLMAKGKHKGWEWVAEKAKGEGNRVVQAEYLLINHLDVLCRLLRFLGVETV